MFENSGLTELIYYADRIPNECFKNCANLTSVKIENNAEKKPQNIEKIDKKVLDSLYFNLFIYCFYYFITNF